MTILYNMLSWLLLLLAWPVLALASLALPKRRGLLWRRLGFQQITAPPTAKSRRPVWVHALSVGEVTSAVPLVQQLTEILPDRPVVVSATTRTGFETAERLLGRQAAAVFYFPLDFSPAVCRLARRVDPALVVIVESDIWPNFLRIMGKRAVPVILANARLSERSFRGYQRLAALMRPTLRRFAVICAQTAADTERFVALGIDPAVVQTTGNLKFDQAAAPMSPRAQQELRSSLDIAGSTTVIVAGSTHPGEEEIINEAFQRLRPVIDDVLLIIAPRDPARAAAVREIFDNRGLTARTLSDVRAKGRRQADVIVVDAIGLLPTLYAIASVALIGGSLRNYRGHNPLEPAAHGRPILFGPHMEDFREIADLLTAAGAARRVDDSEFLRKSMTELLRRKDTAAAMGEAACRVFAEHRGAAEKVAAQVQQRLTFCPPRGATGPLARWQSLLLPLSWIYGAGARLRRKLYTGCPLQPRRLPCPVISIGNLTAGGTGKTPLTIHIAGLLKAMGKKPVILSRGYRGSDSAKSGIVSDGRKILMDPGQCGDEPFLMARRLPDIPVLIGRDRYRIGARAIQRFSPDVILLDDGFQHFQLARDLDIVLLDKTRPLDNDRLLPAGMLREPPATLRQADIIMFTRADHPASGPASPRLDHYLTGQPRFDTRHDPFLAAWIPRGKKTATDRDIPSIDVLSGRQAFVFCGLANNPAFVETVRQLSVHITGCRFFRDHHAYTAVDLSALARLAEKERSELIITSYKDYVKFDRHQYFHFSCDLAVLDVAIAFIGPEEGFTGLVTSVVPDRT